MDIQYIEYGKVFSDNGATDFVLLAYSDPLTLERAGSSRCEVWLDGALAFPDNARTPFAQQIGKVSVALLATRDGYIFTQIQRRKEGELSHRLGFVPRIDRPYNQERMILLLSADIKSTFAQKASLYTNLLYDKPTPDALYTERFSLKDYRISERPDPNKPEIAPPPLTEPGLEPSRLATVSVSENLLGAVKLITNALVNSADPGSQARHPILIKADEMKLQDKLAIVQMVQYLVYPRLGVITFTLDYVSDQSVALQFFSPPIPETLRRPEHEFTVGNGEINFADDYYRIAAEIKPDELYHPTLEKYLLSVYQNKPLSTVEAYDVFFAVENGNRIADKAWLSDRLIKYFRYILQENDFERVLGYFNVEEKSRMSRMDIDPLLGTKLLANLAEYPREQVPDRATFINSLAKYHTHLGKSADSLDKVLGHLTAEEFIALIKDPKTDEDLFWALLEYQLNHTDKRLASYFRFHQAIPRERLTDRAYALLQAAVKQSPVSDLDKIPERGKIAIYSELLRARREINDPRNSFMSFVPEESANIKQGPRIIQALLQRASSDLARLFNQLQPEDPRLQPDILDELHQEHDLEKTTWYLENLPALTPDLFSQVVEWFVQPAAADLVNNAQAFKKLLAMGQKLYTSQPAGPQGQTLLHNLPAAIRQPLLNAGMAVAIKVPAFAEWWLYTELARMDPPSIENCYTALWQEFDRTEPSLKSTTPEFQFLMGNGDSQKGMSLQKACKYLESNQPNEPLFGAVLNTWQKLGLPLPIADITKLIHQLPESTQNLVRIVRDDAHAGILTGLSAKAALQWLESTQGVERKAYLSPQGEDMLYMRLHSIQRPDLALIWRMLVEEPGAYTEKVSWGDYLEDCDYWLNKARKLNLPVDSKLYLYNELAKSLKDPSKLQDETNRSKLLSFLPVRREVLALLAEQSKSPITDSVERIIDQWIYLLGFWLFEKNPLVQSYVVNALRINVERSDLLNIIVDYHLNLDSLSRLLEFSKENAVSPESIRIITNEIERRKTPRPTLSSPVQGFTPGTVANESFPTYDRLVQPEPWSLPSRSVQRKKTRSFSRRGFCLGIGLLILILFVAVVAVILVVIIITTPDLLNQIPDFLGQLSNFLSKIFP